MKKIFFVSDTHFGLQSPEKESVKEMKFLAFLDHVAAEGEQLYILGDLFDYWFEYNHVIPRGYHRVLTKLGDIVRSGIRVEYLAGNHDFWLRDFFPVDLGILVHKEPILREHNGRKFYLHHGDGLALRDTGYRILKRILRNPINIFLFSLIHPDIAASIAKKLSRKSREYTATKDYGETDGMILIAGARIAEGCDYVIMGHRHVPLERHIEKGIYINLGDWITHDTFAEFNSEELHLRTWKS
jgi:UDP-2,3-diacylglucosamine hydrolase